MEFIHFLLELLTHTKDVLLQLFQQYGPYIYAILFLIIFVETGLVIMPFLPGDSLLFTAGLLCAQDSGLNIFILIPLLKARYQNNNYRTLYANCTHRHTICFRCGKNEL